MLSAAVRCTQQVGPQGAPPAGTLPAWRQQESWEGASTATNPRTAGSREELWAGSALSSPGRGGEVGRQAAGSLGTGWWGLSLPGTISTLAEGSPLQLTPHLAPRLCTTTEMEMESGWAEQVRQFQTMGGDKEPKYLTWGRVPREPLGGTKPRQAPGYVKWPWMNTSRASTSHSN